MTRENRSTRTVLTVFIGSPGDLQPEREETRRVVNGLNSHLARNLGVFIELRGWEDTLPGYSRPQEKINKDVRESDLFIGLVWYRWGTPTGEYSSGFEEEYAVAREQRSANELEDIWLFFKEVPQEMLRDPGEQLRKVQQFKERVTSEREVLYDNFQTKEDWPEKLFNYLSDYLTKDLRGRELAQSGMAPAVDTDSKEESEESDVERSMSAATTAVIQGDLDQVGLLQAARAYSASSAAYYIKRPTKQLTGTHENQFLYQYRTQLQLTQPERIHLLRDLAADSDNLRVGWFWLEQISESISSMLLTMSSYDGLEHVRAGALRLIEHIGADSDLEQIEEKIDDTDTLVATTALRVYARHAPSPLDKLKELARNQTTEIAGVAWREALKILVRQNAEETIAWVLDPTLPQKPNYINVLSPLWTQSGDARIFRDLMKADDVSVRRAAFQMCKTSLSSDEVKNVGMDSDSQLRAAALVELISRSSEVSEQEIEESLKDIARSDLRTTRSATRGSNVVSTYALEDVLLQLYKVQAYEDLEGAIAWTVSPGGPTKYEALADKYFERFKATLREDLTQDFARLKDRFYTRLAENHGDDARSLIEDFKKYEGFISDLFRASAFKALSRHAESEDVDLARDFLGKQLRAFYDTEAAVAALEIVEKHGASEDVGLINDHINSADPAIKSTAANAMLQLDPDPATRAVEFLLNSGDPELIRILLGWLLRTGNVSHKDKIKDLLYWDRDSGRLYALSYIIQTSTQDQLEQLLESYPNSNRYYYYNVLCWLDRILYAPQGLREEYAGRIKQRLTESFDP